MSEDKMSDQIKRELANIVDETGGTMIAIEKLGREGDRLLIYGHLMGSMPAKLYMSPEDYWRLGVKILKNPAIIFYAFALPFLLLKRRR